MTGFNPFPVAAPDFGDPLGLLRACHGRIAELETEHLLLAHNWNALRPLLAAGVAPERGEFEAVVADFIRGYRDHAAKENERLLPRAAQLLDAGAVAALGAAMARRRGVA